jgi:hypothetical protein
MQGRVAKRSPTARSYSRPSLSQGGADAGDVVHHPADLAGSSDASLTRLKDEYLEQDGVQFLMADEDGSTVACRVSHEALRDHADRVHFSGTDGAVFEAYRELIEELACLQNFCTSSWHSPLAIAAAGISKAIVTTIRCFIIFPPTARSWSYCWLIAHHTPMIETVDLQVEARDQDIVVTMPGTSLRVVYRKPHRVRSSWRGSTIFKISRRVRSRAQSSSPKH